MARKTVRRSIAMTPEMHDRLALLLSKHPRTTTEADLIREAVRRFLDEQEDLIGSRRHFQKSMQERLDLLESALTFHLNVLIFLVAALDPDRSAERITNAIVAARSDGSTLSRKIKAVHVMRIPRK
jgi:Arc/MetJ-type ribon-helix-helix transcriptional regulator